MYLETRQLLQLMNIVSNLIFHCNNCDAIEHSSQFVKARQPRQVGLVVYLMKNLRLRGLSLTNHFRTDS